MTLIFWRYKHYVTQNGWYLPDRLQASYSTAY